MASPLADRLKPESIYTLKLKLRGISLRQKKDEKPLQSILVEDAMTPIGDLVQIQILAQVRLTLTTLAAEHLQHSLLLENITHPRKI